MNYQLKKRKTLPNIFSSKAEAEAKVLILILELIVLVCNPELFLEIDLRLLNSVITLLHLINKNSPYNFGRDRNSFCQLKLLFGEIVGVKHTH